MNDHKKLSNEFGSKARKTQAHAARTSLRKPSKEDLEEVDADYQEALEVIREATRKFRLATTCYRSRLIGDAEYLAARKVYNEASVAFDRAAEAHYAKSEEES